MGHGPLLRCLVSSNPAARPREISSRSAGVSILRMDESLSRRPKIKCYDPLTPGNSCGGRACATILVP